MAATGAVKVLTLTAATTDQTSADWELPAGADGAYFVLNLTASSGSTGGVLHIDGKDELSGQYFQINADATAVKTAAVTVYLIYPSGGSAPGAGSGITQLTNNAFLPPKGRVRFTITDGSHTGTVSMTARIS